MRSFPFWKQLKKKLMRKRRGWLALAALLLLTTAAWRLTQAGGWPGIDATAVSLGVTAEPQQTEQNARLAQAAELLKGLDGARETYLRKSYVCGEESQRLGLWTAERMLEELGRHPDWTPSLDPGGKVTFTQQIDDLSPSCKDQAVFGIDADGNLSLFSGAPGKDNIIRTFFQLNIRHLESSLPRETVKQLHDGIRISDLAEYNSVLSTFSDYAVEEDKRAMTTP
ncbi:BofC C-terminal domain-containing protein [Paenibacillus athensensis]|uniref:Bypass of forespore C C-terminal domain-containing protein n=1 Tax=Paenibacillus athensensis TaxID=1967502 RepID=A0A4Y8Q0S9_9BACL|nr:BofC C-terminal domain-containing protein [Paenibacillus athensensis]MCD1258233.1 BofC C-terminal domain-containing protein [Paenibacillus athensensis]